jgi:5'-3' exonuclease
MVSLLNEPHVTHVGIAFDTVIESVRNKLFAGYKTGDGIDPALFSQFPIAEQAARALGLVTWSMIDFECDDALATMAALADADPRVERVSICSPDKDLTQCVRGDRIVTVDRMRKKTLNEAGVIEKFGVPPALIPDLLALTGDDADGVPGLAGFGLKGAAAVLTELGPIEALPAPPWPKTLRSADKLAATFAGGRDAALLYKRLTTLVKDVPLETSVDDLRWERPSDETLRTLGALIDDDRLPERLKARP